MKDRIYLAYLIIGFFVLYYILQVWAWLDRKYWLRLRVRRY
jgi:hypothetical protein